MVNVSRNRYCILGEVSGLWRQSYGKDFMLISFFLLVPLLFYSAVGETWCGWRGLSKEGRSQSSLGPTHWSCDKNIAWKVKIPGLGHSSPVVTEDAVYLTTAYLSKQSSALKISADYVLFFCAFLLASVFTHLVVRGCKASNETMYDRHKLRTLIGGGLIVTTLCGVILFGSNYFDLQRCSIRQWIVSGIFVSLCLLLCGICTCRTSGLNLVIIILSLAFAGVTATRVPARSHAYAGGVFSGNSSVMLAVIGLPFLIGMYFFGRYLSGRSNPAEAKQLNCEAVTPRSPVVLILKCFSVGIVGLILLNLTRGVLQKKEFTPGVTYEPTLAWWVPVCFGIVLFVLLTNWRFVNKTFWISLSVVLGFTLLCVVSVICLAEHIAVNIPYLAYHLGAPKWQPMLGWWFVGAFGVGYAVFLAICVTCERHSRKTNLGKLSLAIRVLALFLATFYFVSCNYLSNREVFIRAIICIDRGSGEIQWICEGLQGTKGRLHRDNSSATPTLVTDGQQLYAYFGSTGFLCTDLRGKILWTSKQIPFETVYGVATSPILCEDKIIVCSDSRPSAYLAALHCKTGQLMWKTDRESNMRVRLSGNNRTPLVKTTNGRKVVLVWGHHDINGYDPLAGKLLWSHQLYPTNGDMVSSMVSDDKHLYLAGPHGILALAIVRLGTEQDPVVWHRKVSGPVCPSPVVTNRLLFTVTNGGRIYCMDGQTGITHWQKRLKGKYYSSPVAIGDRIYFTNTDGLTTVVACDTSYKIIAENTLKEQEVYASFAPVDGELFVRTKKHLYCIQE